MTDSSQFQIHTPDFPGAAAAANLIVQLLKQELDDFDPGKLDHTFFRVLADFESQANAAGMPREQNPFRRLSDELVEWLRERTLAGMQAPDAPEEFAEDIGRFRHMTHEAQQQPGMLVLAARHLEQVAARIDAHVHPAFRSQVYNDLGTTYADLQVLERRKALTRALQCYETALEYRTPQNAPREYAATTYNRGNALLHLPAVGPEREDSLARAIAAFESALAALDLPAVPFDDALINLGLGTALAVRTAGDRAVNFHRARACFDHTLAVFTRADYLPGWALAQARLGAANYHGAGSRAAAAEHFRNALQVYTAEAAPYDDAALSVQLALALADSEPGEAGGVLERVMEFLGAPRSSQQNAQLVGSFGPAFAPDATPERRAELAAAVSRLAMRRDRAGLAGLVEASLRRIVADPARAGEHAARALEALMV